MRCQYPITEGIAPQCRGEAKWRDTDGRVYCGDHGTSGLVRIAAQSRDTRDVLWTGGTGRKSRHFSNQVGGKHSRRSS